MLLLYNFIIQAMSDLQNEDDDLSKVGASRRNFLTQITVAGAGLSFASPSGPGAEDAPENRKPIQKLPSRNLRGATIG